MVWNVMKAHKAKLWFRLFIFTSYDGVFVYQPEVFYDVTSKK